MMLVLKMALRNVLRQRRRSLLTVLSMAVGYALLSISLSVGDGSYNLIISQFTSNITGHVQIHKTGYLERPSLNKSIKDPKKLIADIKSVLPDASVTSRIKGGALAYGEKRVVPVSIMGIDPKGENEVTGIQAKVKEGDYFASPSAETALLGAKIAENLKLGVGDDLILISSGADGSIANAIYNIKGIVGQKDSQVGNMVVLSLAGANEFFSMGPSVHEIIVKLEHFRESEQATDILRHKISREELAIQPWQEVEKEFYQSMEADKKGNNISILIIVIMVGIGVLNTVLMAVLERMREYGLLRAIGVRPNSILSLVLLESSILSCLGTLMGIVMSLPVNYWFQEYGIKMEHPLEIGGMVFDKVIGEISYNSIVFPGIVIFVTAVIVSLFPAIKAASVSPIQVIDSV